MEETPIRYQDSETWEGAARVAAISGPPPLSFVTPIRLLMVDYSKDGGDYQDANRAMAVRLLRSPTMMSSFARACRIVAPERFTDPGAISPAECVSFLKPLDFSALLASLYLYKRVRKLAEGKELDALFDSAEKLVTLGMQVGAAVPGIGLGMGALVGGLQHMAHILLVLSKPASIGRYRSSLRRGEEVIAPDFELGYAGCASTQVASVLLQRLGFGVGMASSFGAAFHKGASRETQPNRISLSMWICSVWIDSLARKQAAPQPAQVCGYLPSAQALERLVQAATAGKSGSEQSWLGKEALPEESTASEERGAALPAPSLV